MAGKSCRKPLHALMRIEHRPTLRKNLASSTEGNHPEPDREWITSSPPPRRPMNDRLPRYPALMAFACLAPKVRAEPVVPRLAESEKLIPILSYRHLRPRSMRAQRVFLRAALELVNAGLLFLFFEIAPELAKCRTAPWTPRDKINASPTKFISSSSCLDDPASGKL